MIRRLKLIAIILALVLIFLIVVTPLLVTPSVAAYSIREYSNTSIEASSFFDQNQGQLSSKEIMLNLLSANFGFSPSGIFSFTQDSQKTIQFGVYYSQLIEFNDTNKNHMLDAGDYFIRNVSLDDFTWAFQQLNFSSDEVVLPLIGVKPPISIVFMLHLYLTTKNVSLSDEYSYINLTAYGNLTVKTFVLLNGYDWTPNNGSLPDNSRMLALEMTLRSEVNPGNQKHMFQLANGSRFNGTQNMNNTRPVPSIPGTNQSSIYLVTQGNITHGELHWFNKAIADGGLKNLSSSFMTNGTAFNLYLSVPYYGNNTLFLDPSFSMQNAPSGGAQVSLEFLLFILPYYTPSMGLLYLSIIVVSVAALIIGTVYYLRRKRL